MFARAPHLGWICLLLPLLAGCVSLNRYGTARTLDAGAHNTSVTLDVLVGASAAPAAREVDVVALPAPHLRHNRGIAEGTELVLDLGLPGTLGVDIKRELLRTRRFDLAVAPGIGVSWLGDLREGFFGEVHLPLIADVVLADWLVLVPQVAAGWAAATTAEAGSRSSALASGGLGVYFRVGETFAIQPLASTTVELDTLYLHHRFGLGLSFGAQPHFR